MNIEDLTLKQINEIISKFGAKPQISGDDTSSVKYEVGRQVIVRSREQGCMFGSLQSIDGSTVTLLDAVQLWQWKAKKGGTLADVAEFGVKAEECKFSVAKADVIIINSCAVIYCTNVAADLLSNVESSEKWK